MAKKLSPADTAKDTAAMHAVNSVENGMKIGLGSGSTAARMVRRLGERIQRENLTVIGVPTSEATAKLARKAGVPLTTLDEAGRLDLTIDGTDEFDAELNLIKGGGGALLREKIVASASEMMIIIADDSKQVARLGKFPLPVEILPFGGLATKTLIENLLRLSGFAECEVRLRMSGKDPFLSDSGNHILDLHLNRIDSPLELSLMLNGLPGVIENGLFINVCQLAIIGHSDGFASVINYTQSQEGDEPAVQSDSK